MASKHSSSSPTALRYATALIDIAIENKALENVEKDLHDLEAMINNSAELQAVLRSPLIKRQAQADAIAEIARVAQFHDITRNFLALLSQNRRLNIISSIMNAIRTEIGRRRGEIEARVQAAYTLSDAQEKALKDGLSKATGQTVSLNVEINKDIIGGLVITIGSQMIDDSVKRKMERLSRAMKTTSNQNQLKEEEVS